MPAYLFLSRSQHQQQKFSAIYRFFDIGVPLVSHAKLTLRHT